MLTQPDAFGLPAAQPDASAPSADKVLVRAMPLGASITYGYKSTDGNGYRKDLRDKLRKAGYPVNMVGSRKSGTMKDNVSRLQPE